jgi:hypothetical protein
MRFFWIVERVAQGLHTGKAPESTTQEKNALIKIVYSETYLLLIINDNLLN